MNWQRIVSSLLFCALICVEATRVFADDPGSYAAQLAVESDALLRCAIHRPYGWAWDRNAAGELLNHPTPHIVSMDSMATPAAGLVLLWVGKFLNEPRYLEAAEEVARGIAASQSPAGRIPTHPVFGSMPGGRPETAVIPDRTATNTALGLFLALIESNEPSTAPAQPLDPHAEAVHRAAERCARWLVRQEARNGLWPSVYPTDAAPKDAVRIVRLDDPDYRNGTLALMLSFEVLHDDVLHHFAQAPLDGLLKLRLLNDAHGPGLWCTACTVDGTDIPAGFPNGPDVLASRYGMQMLLAGYLFTDDPNLAGALNQAAKSLGQDKRPDGLYDRFLDPTAAADVARSLGKPGPPAQTFFTHPTSEPTVTHSILADPSTSGDFGVTELLTTIAQLKSLGRDRYLASFPAQFLFHQQVEACLCGLSNDVQTSGFPIAASDMPGYLNALNVQHQSADSLNKTDLPARVRRLWILLLQARLEHSSALNPRRQ